VDVQPERRGPPADQLRENRHLHDRRPVHLVLLRIRFGSYVTAGAISGIGAVVTVATLGSYNAESSNSYLLPVFAAVFLGTAIIQPGRFNPIGTWIGVYFLYTGILGLEDLGLQQWVSDVFYGGVLVVAVTISTLLRRRST
jgi:ribose transport system permease protein